MSTNQAPTVLPPRIETKNTLEFSALAETLGIKGDGAGSALEIAAKRIQEENEKATADKAYSLLKQLFEKRSEQQTVYNRFKQEQQKWDKEFGKALNELKRIAGNTGVSTPVEEPPAEGGEGSEGPPEGGPS